MYHKDGILIKLSDAIHQFVTENLTDGWFALVMVKVFFLVILTLIIDFVLKFFINFGFRSFKDEEKYPVIKAVYESGFSNSIAHVISLTFAKFALEPFFRYKHPQSFNFLDTLIAIAMVVVIGGMAIRFLKAVEYYLYYKKDYYRIAALKTVSQTLKVFGGFILALVIISMIFGINGSTIVGSLGAITAVLVLVFRDTILGFITGLHVATSRNMKSGDWIGIPKYNLEGTIDEIGLLTTKITNFDKTVSTIPTYDLMSTEIKNLQVMSETNTRRIKRSIIFNIKSFKFIDEELYERLSKINLIKDYIEEKHDEILFERMNLENSNEIINGQQLTNIGTFRIYTLNYLKNNKNVDQGGTVMVRQLEITPQGLPLEIYCFTNDSRWESFEQIQANIFDHLLVSAKEFDLEVMQFTKI